MIHVNSVKSQKFFYKICKKFIFIYHFDINQSKKQDVFNFLQYQLPVCRLICPRNHKEYYINYTCYKLLLYIPSPSASPQPPRQTPSLSTSLCISSVHHVPAACVAAATCTQLQAQRGTPERSLETALLGVDQPPPGHQCGGQIGCHISERRLHGQMVGGVRAQIVREWLWLLLGSKGVMRYQSLGWFSNIFNSILGSKTFVLPHYLGRQSQLILLNQMEWLLMSVYFHNLSLIHQNRLAYKAILCQYQFISNRHRWISTAFRIPIFYAQGNRLLRQRGLGNSKDQALCSLHKPCAPKHARLAIRWYFLTLKINICSNGSYIYIQQVQVKLGTPTRNEPCSDANSFEHKGVPQYYHKLHYLQEQIQLHFDQIFYQNSVNFLFRGYSSLYLRISSQWLEELSKRASPKLAVVLTALLLDLDRLCSAYLREPIRFSYAQVEAAFKKQSESYNEETQVLCSSISPHHQSDSR